MRDTPAVGAAQVIAVDLGGTTVRAARVRADGSVLSRLRAPLSAGEGPKQVIDMMNALIDSESRHAVVGLPGRVNRAEGRLERARNLHSTDLDGLSAVGLSEATGLDVRLAGDAELAAVGEAYFGAGSTEGTTAYLTLSTGVGGAAVADGRVMAGSRAGFQLGFLHLLGPDRPIIDELASGQRVRKLSDELGRPVPDMQSLLALVDAGESSAVHAFAELVDAAVAAALLMCHICSPDILVIGGGLARGGGSRLVRMIAERVADQEESHFTMPVEVKSARLGDDAGLIGAAAWNRACPLTSGSTDQPIRRNGEER